METKTFSARKGMYVRYHMGLSQILSPIESRFLMHMIETHYLSLWGFKIDFTRQQYMKRMGLKEHSFDSAAKSLLEFGLIDRAQGSCRNRVYYELNVKNYERLTEIVSSTQKIEKLRPFLDFNFKKLGRAIDSISDQELAELSSVT